MKILITSFFFPPYNTIGAVRTGKLAKYLFRMGHDVRVIAAAKQALPETLPLEIPQGRVAYTDWFDVNFPRKLFTAQNGKKNNTTYDIIPPRGFVSSFLGWAKSVYISTLNFPDPQIGWLPYAVSSGQKTLEAWRPEFIYASASPYKSLLVARRLSKDFCVPWVAEFRDLWVDNHYREIGAFRNWVEAKFEAKVLRSASGLVTVSEPAVNVLRFKYSQPCTVITNGFDPEDFDTKIAPSGSSFLRIVYTGQIYSGKRDPSNLFKALELLGSLKERVRIEFFGQDLDLVDNLARKFDCGENWYCIN